jgi:D-psicose/D-tagatose/L-ribulose 3-epimerase
MISAYAAINGIWRDTWKDNVAVAKQAKAFIEERFASAERRRQVTRTV